jgi:hypothetical protein
MSGRRREGTSIVKCTGKLIHQNKFLSTLVYNSLV